MDRYLEFVSDEKQLTNLRKHFETYTGRGPNIGDVK